ncbi:MAG: C4-type zinc ribbon domain-containing protein [Bacteroidetes bacterium]|nr:C4-type zinc ribbon domain-containing protein [Bacteroidota bacterium]
MNSQIYKLALLSKIDDELDVRKEEFGDLPEKLKNIKIKFEDAKKRLEESEQILSDNKKFAANAKVKLKALKDKEDKLSKQQFLVRNNKEFDAITKEIENSRDEYSKLSTELRTTGIKEENLITKIDEQKQEVKNAESEYEVANEEFNTITNDQDEDVKRLVKKRKDTLKKINKEFIKEYNRIRDHTRDATVRIKRNSCSGCFSAIPPQKIVEIRNDLDLIFTCENCGRILYPEDIIIGDDEIFG